MTAPLSIQDNITLAFCWTHNSPMAPEEGVSRLRESGFEGVELWPEPLEKYGVQRWAWALADNGMRCSQLCPYFDFVSSSGGAVNRFECEKANRVGFHC